jgi:chromosome segregation ATPase
VWNLAFLTIPERQTGDAKSAIFRCPGPNGMANIVIQFIDTGRATNHKSMTWKRMKKRTKAELLAWIEQHQPVSRGNLLRAFEDMDYEQLQGSLSELQRERRLFEVNPETYYTTIEEMAASERKMMMYAIKTIDESFNNAQ